MPNALRAVVGHKHTAIIADRNTHRYTGRGEYSFEISVSGNRLSGSGTMQLYDANSMPGGAIPTSFTGDRVTLAR